MTKHSEKWKVVSGDVFPSAHGVATHSESGEVIAIMMTPDNAAQIVSDHNTHDALVKALKAIIYPSNGRTIDFISEMEYYRAYIEGSELERARAILEAVKTSRQEEK